MNTQRMIDDMEYIAENVSYCELLCQLAEECAELAQAALKYRRTLPSVDNPTPIDSGIAYEKMTEEVADVLNCIFALEFNKNIINIIAGDKLARWRARLEELKNDKADSV